VNRVDYNGEFWFPVTPGRLRVMIGRFGLFESWWGWQREFQADGARLVTGNGLHGTVVPPAPCRLRLDIRLQRCDRPRSVQAAVGGDLSGPMVLRLADAGIVAPGFSADDAAYLADRFSGGNRHPGTDSILRLPGQELISAGVRAGDLLIATEASARTIVVLCASSCTARSIAAGPAIAHAEGHIAFTSAGR
jgi:hypothetical protein